MDLLGRVLPASVLLEVFPAGSTLRLTAVNCGNTVPIRTRLVLRERGWGQEGAEGEVLLGREGAKGVLNSFCASP